MRRPATPPKGNAPKKTPARKQRSKPQKATHRRTPSDEALRLAADLLTAAALLALEVLGEA
jgi:hypothetical protein